MITILHGDDTAASRNFLQGVKSKSTEYTVLHAAEIDLTSLSQIFEGQSLFETTKTVIIEDVLSGKKGEQDQNIITFLAEHTRDHDVYLWEKKEVTKTILAKFPGSQNIVFKLPQMLFQFIDSIRPGNTKLMLTLFHKTAGSTEPELIFYMLVRQFRLLIAQTDAETIIDETKRLAPWQKAKLQKQASYFSKDSLIAAYTALFTIDVNHKTGKTLTPLPSSIDFFLATL